jgi:hypothetical protein
MAITQRGSVTTGKTSGNSGSLNIAKPTGVVSGDVLFAFLSTNNGTITEPSGWTRIYEQTSGVNAFMGSAYYKVAGGSEGSSYDWSNSSSTGPMMGFILALVGVDGTTPVDLSTNYNVAGLGSSSEALTTPTVSGNTEDAGRILYVRHTRDASSTGPNSFTEASASHSELADDSNASGSGTIHYSLGLFWGDADFSGSGSKSGLAITAATAETDNVHSTIVVSASGGGGAETADAGVATASATASTTSQPAAFVLTDETVPTYEVFIDWDNDGGLDLGNFELDTQGWAATNSGTVIEASDEQVHLGQANSLKVTWDGSAGQDVWKHKTSLVAARHYTFSAWVYVMAGSAAVRLEVDGVATGTASATTGAWEFLDVEFTATSAVHTIRLEPNATPTNGDVAYMDQVMVICDGEDVTSRVMGLRTPLSFQYGRDTARSLSEIQPGETSMTLLNDSRDYSPDNTGSPLYGLVMPGRACVVRATYNGKTHTLFNGFIDDFVLVPDAENQSLEVTALDVLQKLNEATISTELYHSIQTGTAIGYVLDAIGWPSDKRDLDQGASTIRWWWEEETDAFEALGKIVSAEGPPAFTFVDSAGNFVFRDRHHRVLTDTSITSQATFVSGSEDKITFVATGDAYSTTSAGTSFTLNKPTGSQASDLYVAFVVTDSVSTCSVSGWTLVRSTTLDDGTDDLGLFVLVKDAAADDPDTWTGSVSVSSSRRFARVLAYRGTAPAANQFVTEDASTSTGTTATLTTPSVANTVSGAWRLALFVAHEDETNTGWGSYSPTATERFDNEVGTSDPVLAIAAADSNEPVSAESGKTATATLAGTSAVDSSAAWIGLIRPWAGTGLRFSLEGFEYDIGWKDIVNSVSFAIEERNPTTKQVVWESEEQLFVIPANTTRELIVESDEPFYKAAIPVEDTDYVLQSGAVTITLSRTSGATTTIFMKATSAAVVHGMRLQATPVPVSREVVVKLEDRTSINNHGVHSLQEEIESSWLNSSDAEAVAKAILGLRAERLPLITFQIVNSNNEKMLQILTRDLSDRIHVVENQTFTDHDFFIERIEQEIEEVGWNHRAVFGCERAPNQVTGTFKFGSSGPGFDSGRLGTQGGNNSDDVFILGQSQLDQKVLGI